MSEIRLQAYLATALTGLDEAQRENVFSASERIAVLCERFGILLYQPKDHTDPVLHAKKPAREVYLTDRERVATSDLVLALCGHPSHGVGAENEIAGTVGVPIVYLVPTGSSLSKMLLGSLGDSRKVEYSDLDDLDHKLSTLLEEIRQHLLERRTKRSASANSALPSRLRDLRERSGLTIQQLAHMAGISPAKLEAFEAKDEKVTAPTTMDIRNLSEVLGVPPSYFLGETLVPKDRMAYQSIEALKEFARNKRLVYPVYETLRAEYLRSRTMIGFAAETRDSAVLTAEDWASRYERFLKRGQENNLGLWD